MLHPSQYCLTSDLPLQDLESLVNLERLKVLVRLKDLGLSLPERQKLANAVAKAKREGFFGVGRGPPSIRALAKIPHPGTSIPNTQLQMPSLALTARNEPQERVTIPGLTQPPAPAVPVPFTPSSMLPVAIAAQSSHITAEVSVLTMGESTVQVRVRAVSVVVSKRSGLVA